MSAVLSQPAPRTRRGTTSHHHPQATPLDVVHDHVLRAVGDREAARRVLVDVVVRANARALELDEAPTTAVLLRHARARLAATPAAEGTTAFRDVEGLLPAPADLHARLLDAPRRPLRRLAWLAPVAATLAVATAALTGLPDAVAAVTDSEVPAATARAVPAADAP